MKHVPHYPERRAVSTGGPVTLLGPAAVVRPSCSERRCLAPSSLVVELFVIMERRRSFWRWEKCGAEVTAAVGAVGGACSVRFRSPRPTVAMPGQRPEAESHGPVGWRTSCTCISKERTRGCVPRVAVGCGNAQETRLYSLGCILSLVDQYGIRFDKCDGAMC